jgi:hypothetical protein
VAKFSQAVADALLADCRRHCCVCLRWAGQHTHIHHIVPDAKSGSGEYDNGIPVCLDCHAEIESKSNMGRRFTADELKIHRERWMTTVREHPEILVRAARTLSETGPLEALLSELDFNRVAVAGKRDDSFPPLATSQFERGIAANALAALDAHTRQRVSQTYVYILRINYHFDELATMQRARTPDGDPFKATVNARNDLRMLLQKLIPYAMVHLARSLGRDDDVPGYMEGEVDDMYQQAREWHEENDPKA